MKLSNEIELKKFTNWTIVCLLEPCRSIFNCHHYHRLSFTVSRKKHEPLTLVTLGEYVANCFGNYCVNLTFHTVLCVLPMSSWQDIKGVKTMIDLSGIYPSIMIIWLLSPNVFKDSLVLLLSTICPFMWSRPLITILMFSSANKLS